MRPRRHRVDLDLPDPPALGLCPWAPLGRRSTISTAGDYDPADADRRVLGLLRLGRTADDIGRMLRITIDEVFAAAERARRAEGQQ